MRSTDSIPTSTMPDLSGARMTRDPRTSSGKISALADARNAVLCGMALVMAVVLTWPVAELPYNDDWSYAITVKQLVETGKLTYNGWSSASLIAHAYWGAAWVKLFGFSFTVLRISTIPLAAGAVALCYLIGRRAGLSPASAVMASLLLGLSPLYLPVAATFMTDAPGLFLILLAIYALVRSAESRRFSSAAIWLFAGVGVGLVGGTGRQIVWIVPLVLVPYAAFLRRRELAFVVLSALSWVSVFAGAVLTIHWFNSQPYSIPEASVFSDLHLAILKPAHFAFSVTAVGLTTIWVTLPVTILMLRRWTMMRFVIAACVFVSITIVLQARPRYQRAPWMDNTLSPDGVMGNNEIAGDRPLILPVGFQILFGVIVFAVLSALIADSITWLFSPKNASRQATRFFVTPSPNQTMLPAMVLFAAAYTALLLPRCARDMAYDRYVLPLMPLVATAILLRFKRDGIGTFWKTVSVSLLAVYAVYAIGATQEVTALARARVTAVQRLAASGIPSTKIDGGFELDYLTELQTNGHINDERLLNPPGAFRKGVEPTPSIQPLYRLECAPVLDTEVTRFGTVSYFSLMPPFHRVIYIDRFKDPWWLNPARAATRPTKSHSMIPRAALGGMLSEQP